MEKPEMIMMLRSQICQVLIGEYPSWFFPKTVAEKLNRRFPEEIGFWERVHRLIVPMTQKQFEREVAIYAAIKELAKGKK